MLRTQEFARIANVTVRTLHHYDRLGLLSPTLRSARGYRLYRIEDLAQLERILVLRYLGMPLREIADLLAAGEPSKSRPDGLKAEPDLAETLARQTAILRERRKGIDRVLSAIEHASQQLKQDEKPDWSLYQTILKEIHMQENQDWTSKYYTPEAQQAIEERKPLWNPEMQAKVTADWQ
ncbi:MAG TPA: MerR family transcriptional regulator, partial [Acidobacteriaceae bacterium]